MKNVKFSSVRAATLCAVLATAGLTGAYAQSMVTTTTSAGTVSQFSPSAITVTSGGAPVSYSYSKTTTYVDENGNPVSVETIRSGMPVTVYYSQEGDRMLASKVIVHNVIPTDQSTVIKKTTTTTTTTP
jgi:multidrug resistance efflux pump